MTSFRFTALGVALVASGAGIASAAVRAKFTTFGVDSVGVNGDLNNVVLTAPSTANAAYTIQRIGVTVLGRNRVVDNRANEARIGIKAGANPTFTAAPYSSSVVATNANLADRYGSLYGTIYNTLALTTTAVTPGATLSLNFYESIDTAGGPDFRHDVLGFAFFDGSTPANTPLSFVTGSTTATLAAGATDWYQIVVPTAVTPTSPAFRIDTDGPTTIAAADTQIGLFNANGGLITFNDDIDFPTNKLSRIAYGAGSGNGATLAAGTYYFGVQAYDDANVGGTMGAGSFPLASFADDAGDYTLNVTVPEPASLSALAAGVLCLRRAPARKSVV